MGTPQVALNTPLTGAQIADVRAVADEWMQAGLSTRRCDRRRAEATVCTAYRTAGLNEPQLIVWMDSPLGGMFAAGVIKSAATFQLKDPVWTLLGRQPWDQVVDQLGSQLAQQLWGQLTDQLGGQLGGQLKDQLGDPLERQLNERLGHPLADNLRDRLWSQLKDQVLATSWRFSLKTRSDPTTRSGKRFRCGGIARGWPPWPARCAWRGWRTQGWTPYVWPPARWIGGGR